MFPREVPLPEDTVDVSFMPAMLPDNGALEPSVRDEFFVADAAFWVLVLGKATSISRTETKEFRDYNPIRGTK